MKRIGFIFTVITLFCLSAVSRVIAQSDWSLINFDLINLPCEPGSHSLTYTMYYGVNPFKVKSFNDIECPIIFGGELVCTRSIDLKEKKEAVNRALSDLGWNFATLRQVIERAAQAKPNDITNEQFWDDLVSMSGLNGLAGDALALISGVKDRDKYYEAERIQGRLKSEAYKYLVNKTLSTVGKIFSLKGRVEIFLNARERDKQKWINCVAEDNLVSLARFYRIANNRLWQIAQTKGQTWVLRVNGSANAPFFYEGEMCVQQWKIKMELEKSYHGANEKLTEQQFYRTFAGECIGWLDAEVLYAELGCALFCG